MRLVIIEFKMYRHVQYYDADRGENIPTTIQTDTALNNAFTILNGQYLQGILRVTDLKPLGKGTSGLVYKAIMNDQRELKCALKLHRDLLEAKPHPFMWLESLHGSSPSTSTRTSTTTTTTSSRKGSEQYTIMRTVGMTQSNNTVFKAVVDEFREEIEYSICLTLGPKVFKLDLTTAHPVAYGLWKEAQAEMKAQNQKPGYQYLHHILEFDLDTIPCIVSKQCDGDLLHIAQTERLDPKYIVNIWATLLSQVLAGIRFMHDQHVAHNDIKPQNIFYIRLDPATVCPFQALVADFGMAKNADAPMYVDFGTPEYVCPELLPAFRNKKAANNKNNSPSATGSRLQTIPKYNDAFTFAKTGLWLWAKFKNKDAKERVLLDVVNALICMESSTSQKAGHDSIDRSVDERAKPLHAKLVGICQAADAAERYRLFQSLNISIP